MTLKYELTKKYHRNEIINVCLMSWEKYKAGQTKTLEHMVDGVTLDIKPIVPGYKNYSHGICQVCMDLYYERKYNAKKAGK